MTAKLKRKYLIKGKEYFVIDSLEEFMSLFNVKYNKASNVINQLYKIASNLKDEKDLDLIEEIITKYVLYNFDAGIYKENNLSYRSHNIITHKMPKDLEKSILTTTFNFDSKKELENLESQKS